MKTISVDANALKQVLEAIIGPPHLIRELIVISGLPGSDNPIGILVRQYNEQLTDKGE